ncbi:MAG: hypothetical protein E7108_01915 [Bacteroidales bacterium]|jgi:hypothetical protein|nr:hypothetical protein [Bacteroidales bacterium]
MALESTSKATAWGSIHAYLGTMGSSDAMASTFEDLGSVKDDDFSIETEKGDVYELKDINGKLLDILSKEPTLTVKFGLIKMSEATRGKFWTMEDSGEGNARKVKVTSLVQNSYMSFKLSNDNAPGSETFEAAKCKVSMDLKYEKDKGYSGDVEVKIIWPDRSGAELFQFGVVPS